MTDDMWGVGDAYEAYVGRWSRLVAKEFLHRVDAPAGRRWADVGCGTGALTATVLASADPKSVIGVDPSEGFLASARTQITDPRVEFRVGDARSLPLPDDSVDIVVSGLAMNFVPEPAVAVAECARIVARGGVVAAYVWDYAEGMAMMRVFWDVAAEVDPDRAGEDEGLRFPMCRPDPLRELWAAAGLVSVSVEAIDTPTVFADFDDYWRPFLGATGAAPAYLASLGDESRDAIRDRLRERLPVEPDGTIPLVARAWYVRGESPA